MRKEIGVEVDPAAGRPHDDDWPWLPDRPSRQPYVQDHPRPLRIANLNLDARRIAFRLATQSELIVSAPSAGISIGSHRGAPHRRLSDSRS